MTAMRVSALHTGYPHPNSHKTLAASHIAYHCASRTTVRTVGGCRPVRDCVVAPPRLQLADITTSFLHLRYRTPIGT